MYTIYLRRNCTKSLSTLLKMFKRADIKTSIIIVDNYYAKLLKSDKRVKSIPFIINENPTKCGLIPKNAVVMSFDSFIKSKCKLKRKCKLKKRIKLKKKCKRKQNSIGRIITYSPKYKRPVKFYRPIKNKVNYGRPLNYGRPVSYKKPLRKKPIIKTIKKSDNSVEIILSTK
jgi:hypothetical protein